MVAGVCIALAALVFVVFGRAIGYPFINFDDPDYTFNNPVISSGVSLSNIGWAFTHYVSDHWHPLTLIVLMLEAQFFGSWAGGYHLVNILLHAAAAIFLFLLLIEMTGAFWRSAFAAALFAIHPLRVESVVWVSECKDVLSAMFFMLTLWAYARYARRKSAGRYAMILLWFALGLMSKPMLVTLPCVLLLLDYWPLGRLHSLSQFPGLLLEKVPLFILTGLSSLAAVLALNSRHEVVSTYPADIPIGYAAYLWKLAYPAGLAMLYPIPREGYGAWEVFNALLILAAVTAAVWLCRRNREYLVSGWLWYLGMLLPVAGVMQTGSQAYSDRYTYLPQVGLCIAGTWLAADLAGRWRHGRAALAAIGAAIICILAALAAHQTGYWRDSIALWSHSIACTGDNPIACDSLGNAYLEKGRIQEAIAEYHAALNVDPRDVEAHYNLGHILIQLGDVQGAIAEYREAADIKPDYKDTRNNLGNALARAGDFGGAIAEYRAALKIDPANVDALSNLGNVLLQTGRIDEAIDRYRAALRIKPDFLIGHANLANALQQKGDAAGAITEYRAALAIAPGNPGLQSHLAWLLATAGNEALRDGSEALSLATSANQTTGGRDPGVLRGLAAAQAQNGDFPEAVRTAQNALALAEADSQANLAAPLRREIQLYQAGRRYQPPP
jgi:tetratricopeptide (TPR) repeat protein